MVVGFQSSVNQLRKTSILPFSFCLLSFFLFLEELSLIIVELPETYYRGFSVPVTLEQPEKRGWFSRILVDWYIQREREGNFLFFFSFSFSLFLSFEVSRDGRKLSSFLISRGLGGEVKVFFLTAGAMPPNGRYIESCSSL